jgi:hypothetical protein
MKYSLEKPYKYDPYFSIPQANVNKTTRPRDHESRLVEDKLANWGSWLYVKAIMTTKWNDLEEATAKVFPTPKMENPNVLPYYIFYRKEGTFIMEGDTNFLAPTWDNRVEVVEDNFEKHNRGP